MKTIEIYQAALPLMKGRRNAAGQYDLVAFLGSATIVNGTVCTCKHVVSSIDPANELVLAKWNLSGQWVSFPQIKLHPKHDFAVLTGAERPPHASIPMFEGALTMGTTVYAAGYHFEGSTQTDEGQNLSIAPRVFFGNVVRVHEASNGHSPANCELSFPTLSGFSGAPLVAPNFTGILGMVYGNIEQSILVHSKYEMKDGNAEFSETVNRILELGLFHRASDVLRMLSDVRAA